ncbi:MAG: hypothetical protein JW791_04145 [Nanoarchaeota archaeon]|nr:hypothetical protein [Nanoarchaeota archaeon]
MSDLLSIKNLMKKKRPVIRRVEKHRKKALPDNWRKPKGHHSKIRRKKRWEMKMPLVGRSTPVSLKNFDKKGRKIVMISTVDDLKLLSKDSVGIVSGKLGLKKKSIIAEAAKGKNYNFINFKVEEVLKKAAEKTAKKEKTIVKKEVVKKEKVEEKPEKPAKKPEKPAKKPAKPVKGGKK